MRFSVAFFTAALAAMAMAWLAATAPALADEPERAVVVTAAGSHAFDVEIADRPGSRSRGLMYRRELGAREGMLFLYEDERHVSMWMRNTYIPLDMIFINAGGTVHRIEKDTEPFSEAIIESGERVLAVLEVRAGTAEAIGLKPGDRVEHPRLEAARR